jgi:hypothetical protein
LSNGLNTLFVGDLQQPVFDDIPSLFGSQKISTFSDDEWDFFEEPVTSTLGDSFSTSLGFASCPTTLIPDQDPSDPKSSEQQT